MTEDRVGEALAREQYRALSGFYNHFIVFVSVIAVLVVINLATGDRFWVHSPFASLTGRLQNIPLPLPIL
jgi:hypothetical protein